MLRVARAVVHFFERLRNDAAPREVVRLPRSPRIPRYSDKAVWPQHMERSGGERITWTRVR